MSVTPLVRVTSQIISARVVIFFDSVTKAKIVRSSITFHAMDPV
jgi:hypothetical protein